MIENLDVIGGFALALFGFIVGRRDRNLRKPIVYRCECGHGLSMHRTGKDTRCDKGNCMCRQYIGQRPVDMSDLAD